ncbi:hypothetical protein [Pontivivens insulae]|uniref:Right handed beta helix domain-containing protein n=1 Tax=Pontivivens insulae TaxID=1639689 RepID=A0A2R8A6I3_9RHOB|nr:hypothetical protein [Pontivivens insulae]RED17950.1 hypothetical protein DFR53_0138 [Pontivivens insulae]SPF27839.1 hypothetical protein POI8812_00134 [Pontivivens insulae]
MNRTSLLATSALAFTCTLGAALADTPILVTSAEDAGTGSLRAALATAAEQDGISRIVIAVRDQIVIESTLDYTGTAPLAIFGNGQTVSTAQDVTLFAASNGADVTINALDFAGPGNWSIRNRADADGAAGKGIFVDVRDDQQGLVTLSLRDVTVSGVANHGIHVSDCSLADACGGGAGGDGEGSPASILVTLENVTIRDAGNGKFDADGLRVDERDEGSVTLIAHDSLFTLVGADGVELDEGQAGDVTAHVTNSSFNDNGAYCDPALLATFLPAPDEAEFEEGQMQESGIPAAITGSPDDGCFEREVSLYDDGSVEEYEFGIDLDDGFDIDEAGDGSIQLVMTESAILGNLDEGLDFDEEGAGGMSLAIARTRAFGNTDDGFKMSEEDDGGIDAVVVASTASHNGGVGAVFEEEDGGDLDVELIDFTSFANDDGETSVELVQEDEGTGRAAITGGALAEPTDIEGVDLSNE